jgi:hypothetical protein
VIRRISSDGVGGVLAIPALFTDPGATPYVLHFAVGAWTTQPVVAPTGKEINVGDLTVVPGSASALAVGWTYLDNGMELPVDSAVWNRD